MILGDKKTLAKLIESKDLCQAKNVVFFGGADIDETHPVYKQAYEVSQLVAGLGKTVVNGGGPGVMQAATLGAQSVGGPTISVAFQPNKKDMPEFSEESDNNHPDVKIVMPDLMSRQLGLVNLADIFVIFKGGTGTLSEWTMVWLFAHLRNGHHKPIILYGDFWHEVLEVINHNFFIDKIENQVYSIATSKEELLQELKTAEQLIKNRC